MERFGLQFLYLLVELVTGSQCILDGILVVWGVEVEEVHAVCVESLQGGVQLVTQALRLQRFPTPGVCLGGQAY